MANTYPMPVANTVELAQKYLERLDAVYKREALTAVLDSNDIEWIGADIIKVFKFDTVGMSNYNRGAGYVSGDSDGGWESFQLRNDRGRSYLIDKMDDRQTMFQFGAAQLSQTARTRLIPEIDAYTFAALAGTTGVLSGTGSIVPGTTNVFDLIADAEAEMDDAEVPYEGRILFVSPTAYKELRKNIERRIINSENNVNYNVEYLDDMRIIRVPKTRFNTAITLNAPTTSDGVGGFTASGSDINFMIVHPSAVIKAMALNDLDVFERVHTASGMVVNFRTVYDAFVYENKVKGIYVHSAE